MTKTSAIFSIVSVLTVAIVGGVFIRKKIIDDVLYWKAWAEFEENKRRKIRSTEEEINILNSSIKKEIKNKEDANKNIEKCKKYIKELEEEIKKYEERIQELKSPVNSEKIKKIDGNIKRRNSLLTKKKEIKSKVEKLKQDDSFQNKLKSELTSIMEILERKETIINSYAIYKINGNTQLKIQEKKKNEKLGSREEILKKLKSSESLFSSIELLIQKFKNKLNEKNNELSSLRQQTFQGN